MQTCHLILSSKNKQSLDRAFFFIINNFKYNILQKSFVKKTKKQFFTILKSPHINKKAQEQFEYNIFSRQLTLYFLENSAHIYFLKKTQKNIFSNVKLTIKFASNKKKEKDLRIQVFDPCNFKLNIFNTILPKNNSLINQKNFKNTFTNQNALKEIKSFLKILDTYGELNIAALSLDSSVGRAKD
jgi:ribosomal protein S10